MFQFGTFSKEISLGDLHEAATTDDAGIVLFSPPVVPLENDHRQGDHRGTKYVQSIQNVQNGEGGKC